VSPIFVRPVREQLEHDRLIRFLVAKYKRKGEVTTNMGDEQLAPVKVGQATFFPDLVLTSGKKLAGVVEVESGESVNNLEAMAQWVHFSRARVPFHLYVPVAAYDVARRLCEANHVHVSELWTYRPLADGFDLMRGFHDPSAASVAPDSDKPKKTVAKPAAKPASAKTVKPSTARPPTSKPPASKPSASKPAAARAAKKKPAKPAKARKAAKKSRKR
jgi:hypothetical protein